MRHWDGTHAARSVAAAWPAAIWFNSGGQSSASAAVNPDGTVNLIEGSTDIGGTRTSIAMQLAETLGIPSESVRIQVVGTDTWATPT